MVTGLLQVFLTFGYALHDPGLLTVTFEIFPEVLHDTVVVSTSLVENVRADRVYKDFPIIVCCRTMCEHLVDLPMNDFDIILCMEWLHSCYACWSAVVGL